MPQHLYMRDHSHRYSSARAHAPVSVRPGSRTSNLRPATEPRRPFQPEHPTSPLSAHSPVRCQPGSATARVRAKAPGHDPQAVCPAAISFRQSREFVVWQRSSTLNVPASLNVQNVKPVGAQSVESLLSSLSTELSTGMLKTTGMPVMPANKEEKPPNLGGLQNMCFES